MTRTLLDPLPVLLVTGFLGSGKTTLVNRLLQEPPRSAVVINEFGAVPIDQKCLEATGAPLAVLSGGCLCCQIRNAMAPLLRNLWMAWRERQPFDQVLIETSGVASPGPVLETLLRDRWLAQRFRLQGVITTVSAAEGVDHLRRFREVVEQIALADALLITHGDLVRPETPGPLFAELDRLAPATPRLSTHPQAVSLETLQALMAETGRFRRLPETHLDHGFRSLTLRIDAPVRWALLEPLLAALLQQHADRLLRLKGIVRLAGGGPAVVVQAAAGRLYEPVPVAASETATGGGQLVFIGTGDLDELAQTIVAAFAGHSAAPAIDRLH